MRMQEARMTAKKRLVIAETHFIQLPIIELFLIIVSRWALSDLHISSNISSKWSPIDMYE